MPYSLTDTAGILVIAVSGAITGAELHNIVDESEALLKARQRWTNALVDLRGLDLSGLGIMDFMGLAGRRVSVKPPNPFRTAVVADSASVAGYAKTLKNLNRDPSIAIEIFEDIDAAKEWLVA